MLLVVVKVGTLKRAGREIVASRPVYGRKEEEEKKRKVMHAPTGEFTSVRLHIILNGRSLSHALQQDSVWIVRIKELH